MKEYLIKTFHYNDWANRKLLESIRLLPETEEAVKLFSHLITSQNKWFNRITRELDDNELAWFGPVFDLEQLESLWTESINKLISYIEQSDEESLQAELVFTRPMDGKKMSVKIVDLALQLNYHSIHHRAQINKIISGQGLKPPATDYIITAIKIL